MQGGGRNAGNRKADRNDDDCGTGVMPRLDASGWPTPAGKRAAGPKVPGPIGRDGGDLRLGILAALLCWAAILTPILLFL